MHFGFSWQDAVALALVLPAGWYLARRIRGVLRREKATACGTCPDCSSDSQQASAAERTCG